MRANDILRGIVPPKENEDVGTATFDRGYAYIERETLALLRRRFGALANAYNHRFLYSMDKMGIIVWLEPFDVAAFGRSLDRL
jgi:hypothetical protein